MGKGGGCVPSKKRQPPATNVAAAPSSSSAAAEPRDAPEEALASAGVREAAAGRRLRLYIVFYSMYGHVEALARQVAAGASAVEGVEAVLRRVPETLPPEVLEKMQAPAKDPAIAAAPADLEEADGVLFGFPTRYGAMAAQMKAFFDSTGSLWEEQRLAGKPAGFFVSTGTQGGGQETTALKAAAGAGKRKKAAVSGKPKRPPSAFFVFMSEFRQEYQAPRSTLTIRVSKAAGEKWRSMSEEEKAPYVDQAGQKKQDYEKSKATFDKKESTRSKKAKIDEDDGEGSDKSKSDVNDDDEDGVSDEDSSKLRKREIDTGTGEAYERSPW